ncbi:DNA sulfur modification protein DndB [Carnimonas nigrificans]|uniref:DNA sulfur modification protein DndB n=1 Tax=Carnimonas nigrificans TaxID=64323 RepID=UPI00046EE0B9|nr:DNA sulfur modification protein DndB [Carnimonas nigrificans]
MYPANDGGMPQPLMSNDSSGIDDLDSLLSTGDTTEKPYTVFIGHNLGHRVFVMNIPFHEFYSISEVANDVEAGAVAQRPLDKTHANNLAKYMLKGLVSAARIALQSQGKPIPDAFERIMRKLGDQSYFSLQPIVCNIREIPLGGGSPSNGGIRGSRLTSAEDGSTASFKVYLSERNLLWVIDGQHRRYGADIVMNFLESVRQGGTYPARSPILYPDKGESISADEVYVWNEAFKAARTFSTVTVEVHLGLKLDQEKQLFHDLNKLGKKVNPSLALDFDGSNPVTQFIKKNVLENGIVRASEKETRDWSQDGGEVAMKDLVSITSIAFLNKSNASGATPAIVDPKAYIVESLWHHIASIQGFGEERAKEKTIAAQPVVLKALAKLTYNLNFSNRRPGHADEQFELLMSKIEEIDFSHSNPVWRYYDLTKEEVDKYNLSYLYKWLPDDTTTANRDVGSYQAGFMRFGSKHNDIFPIIGDMIRYQVGLPSRHNHA